MPNKYGTNIAISIYNIYYIICYIGCLPFTGYLKCIHCVCNKQRICLKSTTTWWTFRAQLRQIGIINYILEARVSTTTHKHTHIHTHTHIHSCICPLVLHNAVDPFIFSTFGSYGRSSIFFFFFGSCFFHSLHFSPDSEFPIFRRIFVADIEFSSIYFKTGLEDGLLL